MQVETWVSLTRMVRYIILSAIRCPLYFDPFRLLPISYYPFLRPPGSVVRCGWIGFPRRATMAEPEGRPMVAAAAGRPGRQAPQQQQAGLGQSLTGIVRMAVFWYFAMKFFGPKKPAEPSQLMSNLFHKGEPLVRLFPLPNPSSFNLFIRDLILWSDPYT